mgnify:CR=1 FL=1
MFYKIVKNKGFSSTITDAGIEALKLKVGDIVEGVCKVASNAILCKVGEDVEPIYTWNLEMVISEEQQNLKIANG